MYASFTRGEIVKRGYHKKNPDQEKFTHTFLDASGVAFIPDNKREWLCGVMAEDWLRNGERTKCAISENVDPAKFTLCMDWDLNNGKGQPLETPESLMAYSKTALQVLAKFDPVDEPGLEQRRWIALRTPQFKMHPYYIGNICSLQHFVTIRLMMKLALAAEHGERLPPKNSWDEVLDDCIYQSSLRAPLTAKFSTCERCKGELKKMDVKKSNKTTPGALKKISSDCPNPDCHHGRICSGPQSIYQVAFVLRPDGTEDKEMAAYLQEDHVAMLKLCTPWHWGKPLSGWQRPMGAELGKMPTKKKTLKNLKLSENDGAAAGKKEKTPTAYAASLKRELGDAEKEHLKQSKCGKLVLPHEEPYKTLQGLLRDGKLGANYRHLLLKSLWRNTKQTVMYGKVNGPCQHLCEIAKRQHGSATIYLQVSNTIMGSAIYMRCWHKDCKLKQGQQYPLSGAEFYGMFPGAKAENAHKAIVPPASSSSAAVKRRRANDDENRQPTTSTTSTTNATATNTSSMVPARKKLKLAGADLLSTLLAESS